MKKKFLFVSLALFLSLFLIKPAWANLAEIQIEQHYTQLAQNALDTLFGPGNFIVKVDVSLSEPRYEVQYTEQSDPKIRRQNPSDQDKINILPGYPVIRNLAPSDFNQLPFDSVTRYISPTIQRIRVDIFANRSFPRGQSGRARDSVFELLGLDRNRDVVELKFVPFYSTSVGGSQEIRVVTDSNNLMTYQNLFSLLLILTLILLLASYVYFQRQQGKLAPAAAKGGGDSANISVNPNIELPRGGSAGGDLKITNAPPIKRFFDFVTESNVGNLNYLIKKENMSPENISVIASYLPPYLASKVLEDLDLKTQAIISAQILNEKLVNRQFVEKLEEHVKNLMECLVGGAGTFQDVFNYVSGEVKKKMLNLLGKSNPEAYKKFRSYIIIFDDLKFLDDEEIKMVLSEANIELLSTALVSTEPNTYQKIDANLTRSAKDFIKQYIELKGKSLSKKDIEAAQDYVLNIVNRLEEDGKINLRGKIKIK